MTTDQTVATQLCINHLTIPCDLQEIVKSYCFYDRVTFTTRQHKIACNIRIEAAMSRANRYYDDPDYSDDDGYWAFGYGSDDPHDDLQLQAGNCYRCGNYLLHDSYENLPPSILCQCIHEENEEDDGFNTDDLYSDDDDNNEYYPDAYAWLQNNPQN
jgi:hypothetical protein